ncbi:MAG TPA: beta-phosphoglucomutase [Patescibacteria group bacterium]|nr:beta-phosphoglucomutase [Patescibacteria group bacterium]
MTDDPRPFYPVDPWRIRELAFDPELAARNETIFSLGNGHLGLRGNLDEEAGNVAHGTYVNGFFEEAPITYGETAHGYAKNHQVLLNVADGKRIQLHVGDDPLDLATGTVEAYERSLDLRTGVLTRSIRWRAPRGAVVEVVARRLVSLTRPSISAIDYAVTVVDGTAPLRITSAINARVRNQEVSDDPRVGARLPEGALRTVHREASGTWGAVVQRTRNTRLAVVAAAEHDLLSDDTAKGSARTSSVATEDGVVLTLDVSGVAGARIALTKFLAYCTSLDHPEEALVARAREAIGEARERGFDGLLEDQRAELERFWSISDVEIDGDGVLQQGVRFNLFSLFQSAGRDGRTSLAAKGLTGEGYEGHYFWDTEVFALPFFVYTQPAIARALLRYRCVILDKARARAAEMSQRGALYPWRTIGGDEASAYFPAGTAQYHINADVAHALAKYVHATGDRTILVEGGAEVIFETARLWADLGAYIPSQGGAFCLNEVTGPDEYTALVNNNCYTNLMAQAHLRYAAALAGELATDTPGEYQQLADRIGLTQGEVAEWRRAADLMRIPRDDGLGIHAQDDSFLTRAAWDFAGTPPSMYPLLLHYHPLVIYRHQVLKQPDVVLAQVLLGSQFSLAEKKRNFDYYDPLTTGDSSLSPCIQSVAAAELGYGDRAYAYFMRTARMDLDDINGNVSHGVHAAAMAGSWVSLLYGFGGLRDDDGRVSFAPRLPAAWSRLRFRLLVGKALLQVTATSHAVSYELLAGETLEIRHFGRPLLVVAGHPATIDLDPRLRCVIFDLDGVITDTAEHHFRAWQRLAAEASLPFDRELNERLKGISRMESLEIILEHAGRTERLEDKVRLAERKNAYFRELIEAITPADLLPGIGDLLAGLRAQGVKTAIASMSHNVWDVVRRLGIEPLIDLIVDPAKLVKGKPDPEIFLTAAEQLGVRFEDCLGIEDAAAGIAAIKAARMVAVGVGRDLVGADWLVPSTAALTCKALEELVRPPAGRAAGSRPSRGSRQGT